jgi:3-hydroxyisobutyrate dehydrogenase-like beta-hydroxyacid dehydrogenase
MGDAVTIGIFSPGAMGSALGRSWQDGGARVVSTAAGRSPRTRALAAGLTLVPSLRDVVAVADVVVSIGPPASAVEMATLIARACHDADRRPLVADLNAIAPTTVERVATVVGAVGCELLDGSISGGPPRPGGDTRLYLSGRSAYRLDERPAPGLSTRVVGQTTGLASAVKMCTASVYKGFNGLLVQALRTARANGVTDPVVDDLRATFGDLLAAPAVSLAMTASKSDRYPGEMREIAATQGAAGADAALFEAMAEVFTSLAASRLARHSPEEAAGLTDLDAVLTELTEPA